MKTPIALLLVLALIYVASSSAQLPSLLSPSFIWSGQPLFNAKMQVEDATIFPDDLADFVDSVINGSRPVDQEDVLGQHLLTTYAKPEVVIVWIEPMGRLAHESYTFLRPSLDSSASSLIIRNYWPAEASIGRWLTIPDSTVVGRGSNAVGNIQKVPKNDLLQHLKNNQAMFSDGKTDMIVVFISHKEAIFYMRSIQPLVEELSRGNYMALFTSNKAFEPEIRVPARRSYVRNTEVERLVARSTADDYWPRSIYEALLVAITFAIILAVGIGCLAELQTPTKWEKTKRNIREVN